MAILGLCFILQFALGQSEKIQKITLDDYFFGIAAVDRDGNESIPVFPALIY